MIAALRYAASIVLAALLGFGAGTAVAACTYMADRYPAGPWRFARLALGLGIAGLVSLAVASHHRESTR